MWLDLKSLKNCIMAIRKRNKIKISKFSNKDEENVSKSNKVTLSLGFSEEEEDAETYINLKPIKPNAPLKSTSNGITNNVTKVNFHKPITTTEEDEVEDILYQDELNKLKNKTHDQPKQVIMNLEDMISVGEISDDEENANIPNTNKLFKGNDKQSNAKRLSDKDIRSQEKEYIKLMDENDKFTLMDTLTKNGRVKLSQLNKNEGDYKYNDELEGGEFADERLPLSNKEQIHQTSLRRKQIEEAISNIPLKEFKENVETISTLKARLPTLCDDEEFNSGDYNNLDDILNQNKLNIKKIEIEIKIVTKKQEALINSRNNLIEQLNKISL